MTKTIAQHTPAPWTVHQYENGTLTIQAREPDGTPCNPARINGDPLDDEYGPVTWANANLVAASPDMLAALQAMAAWGDRECFPMGGPNDGPWELVDAAIAKATA